MLGKKSWLDKLTLLKLHDLALLIGAPCTGTKSTRVAAVDKILREPNAAQMFQLPNRQISIVSIDMGIRNLAYAHITANINGDQSAGTSTMYDSMKLQAWRRTSAKSGLLQPDQQTSERGRRKKINKDDISQTPEPPLKESFEPIEYAGHAYRFIKSMLVLHKPTHVIIERQRFRSGGHSAVLEWTIRVGIFEGMLYTALRTLEEELRTGTVVEPMLPARVNQYWLTNASEEIHTTRSATGNRAVKKAKIDAVAGLLSATSSQNMPLEFAPEAQITKDAFLSKWAKTKNRKASEALDVVKLDDLSDCFLQALTWLQWQSNRHRLRSMGENAFDLGK